MQKIHLKIEPILEEKFHAFSYQQQAVDAVKDLEYSAIFHEQGLGKTKIAIDLMIYWLKEKKVDTIIYLTKKGLISNWKRELANHTYMRPSILSQNKLENYYVFNSPTRLILGHFEVILSEYYRLKEFFLKTRNVAIIIDESAKIKNPDSQLTQALFDLSPLFVKRVIMTGTPVANRPYDLWAQIFFLDHGASLGTDFSEFKKNCDLANDLYDSEEKQQAFEESISVIFDKIRPFSVRETKNSGIITLPKKTFVNIECKFERIQEEMYSAIREELKLFVTKNGIPSEDDDSEVLKRILRLIQVTSNPKLVDENYPLESGKEIALNELVDIIIDRKEKMIIWTSFIENVDFLAKKYRGFGVAKVHGKMSMVDRDRNIKDFLDDPETRILIATPASAKEGLTLTVANNAIFYDRSLSLDDFLQAQDRIHRISQKKDCYIYVILIRDSIDIWVDELLKSKQLAAQLAQGDITLETYSSQISYDFGDIISKIIGSQEDGKNG